MRKNIKKDSVELKLETKIYPLEAIYSTCYVFIDRAYLFLDGNPKKEVRVIIKGKKNLSKKQLQQLAGEFLNELLSATLRMNLDKYSRKIRDYVVERALSSALGQTGSEEQVGYEDDPLGIAIPWEEKYGHKF